MLKILLLLLTILLAGCAKPKQALNVFVWSDYIDPQVIAAFEKEFDCKVTLDFYEDPDSMMAKIAAGGSALYDIVVPSNTTLPSLIKRGLVARLRPENIPNLKNIDPQFTNTIFDPGNQFGAPYQWGTTGLFMRMSKGKPLSESWGLVFDPGQQPGPFLLLEDMRSCLGAALKYKGYSFNSTDPKQLTEARDVLLGAKARSLGFEATVGSRNRVLSKSATLSMVYNNDAVRGVKEDAETCYFVPREGGEIWLDIVSVPAKAPHRDLAEKFVNYLLEPKVSAQLASFTQSATPNRAAREYINPAELQNPAIYPPPEMLERLEYANDLGAVDRLYNEIWTQVKSK